MSNHILTPDRIHGTIVPTPSGPTTLAHYVLAWLVHTLVRRSGGTFVIIIDDLLATMALLSAREPVGERAPNDLRPSVEYWADELIGCLTHYGIGPSSEEELRAQGFDWSFPEHRQMGVKWQSDNTLTRHYYDVLGFEHDFGPWPLPISEGQTDQADSIYLATQLPSATAGGQVHIVHPWVVLSWAVDEMSTGRNMAIDGEDLSSIVGQFGEHAYRLHYITGWDVPKHYTIPTICGQAMDGTVMALSSSNSVGRAPEIPHILISDAVAAGVDREGLDAYVFEYIISAIPIIPNDPTPQEVLRTPDAIDAAIFTSAIRSDVIIDEADWRRFLETGQLKKPRKKRRKKK